MTEDVFLSCSLPGAYHSLLPRINHLSQALLSCYTALAMVSPTVTHYVVCGLNQSHFHMVSIDPWSFMLNRTHDRMGRKRTAGEKKKLTVNISFTCVPSKQWRLGTTHCLINSAVVVFPIHELICTPHLPLAQFSRNRKWSTSHYSPCGILLTTALINTDNIWVTDGDQLPLLKRNIQIDKRQHPLSNIVVMWHLQRPLGEAENALK